MIPEADGKNEVKKLTLSMDRYDDYAEQLKSYRKKHKLKQNELANLLGVKHFTLRSWEQKQAKPPYHVWKLFMEYVQSNNIITTE